jgi:Bacterial DNA-binding protein
MAPRTPKDPDKKPAKARPEGKAAAKPAAKPAGARPGKPALKVVEKPAASAKAAGFKLKDLVEQVASATGAKKPDAKKAVEAVLTALSVALKSGSDLALPPLGKLRIVKTAGPVLTLKLRQGGGDATGNAGGAKPLADTGEDD